MTDQTNIPPHVRELATVCGLTVSGWDNVDDNALVHGPDVNYIGTKAECVAYLTAWQQCQALKILHAMTEVDGMPGVRTGFLSLSTEVLIEPTQSAQFRARPQTTVFRGERVAVPDDLAEHFLIEDIKVGSRSIFVRSGAIPAVTCAVRLKDAFTFFSRVDARQTEGPFEIVMEKAAVAEFGRAMTFPPCQGAADLTMVVTNISLEARPFRSIILGRYA